MKPGDMVLTQLSIHFYSTTSRVNKQLPDGLIPKGTTGIILSIQRNMDQMVGGR